ncbi:MAG: serine hydrolase [Acetobacter sp.]|jgi:CubicO group peptidase (beta-lactamase class C family)
MRRGQKLAVGILASMAVVSGVQAADVGALPPGLTEQKIDDLVHRTQEAFHVPGVGIGIIHNGKIVFTRGYGQIGEGKFTEKVDPETLFAIGSNSKEFTTSALAMLVDEGKLKWDDRVIDIMPEFRVSDPWITREFRVSDLLTHHSGMGLGAGDLLLFSHSTFTRPEVLKALPYMPFTGEFRSSYAYNNLLYVVAGALVEKITGQSWENFVQEHLINAAGMPRCQSTLPVRGQTNVAVGQGHDGKLPDKETLQNPAVAPAGGVWCSVNGMSRWAQILLNGGTTPEGRQIISQKQRDMVWTPHALIPLADTAKDTQSHMRAYGYGWFVEDFFGKKRVWHTGTINGMVSYMSFLPELDTGIVVLTNRDDHNGTYSIATTLSSLLVTGKSDDWVKHWKAEEDAQQAKQAQAASETGPGSAARPFVTLSKAEQHEYVGTYKDDWRGNILVSPGPKGLRMSFDKAPGLEGTLSALPHDLFVVRWDDRGRDGEDDSYVRFLRDVNGRVSGFRMEVIGSDFSFDAQDLHPKKVSDTF